MTICCNQDRTSNFCPDCGQPLKNETERQLSLLLEYLRHHENRLRDRLEAYPEGQSMRLQTNKKTTETHMRKWKSWADAVEELRGQ